MIENILRNTAKLISQFLEFKCIFYEFYKFGTCCYGTVDCPRIRRTVRQGRACAPERSAGTKADTDGQSTKMMDSLGKPQTARL